MNCVYINIEKFYKTIFSFYEIFSRREKQITYDNFENVTFNDTRSSETIFRDSRIEMYY